jgi:phage baseplate assembly protein W
MAKFLNIKFPLQESPQGFFLNQTVSTQEQVRSELSLLITTRRGDRLYKPNYGTNLYNYIFQPLDDVTKKQIVAEIKDTINFNMNNIELKEISFTVEDDKFLGMKVYYSITEGVFKQQDTLDLIF